MKKETVWAVAVLLLICGSISLGSTITLYTPAAGDATYSWNSKYGPSGYGTGTNEIGIYLYFGAPYGNDHTISIFEIPISALAGEPVTSATLEVDALGFGTNYYYGSAHIGWLDTGTVTLTGDVVADALGPASTALPNNFTIYDSYVPGSEIAGTRSFDFLSCIQADLAAGRTYSTFVMSGSRETYGSIYTAESGSGPRIVAIVPEPATICLLGFGALSLIRRKK
jgi:hypothetical protein